MEANETGLCLPVDQWPAEDQRRWHLACEPVTLFDEEGGELAGKRPISIRKYAKGYGRWLTFLAHHDPAALELTPGERITTPRVKAYEAHLRAAGNGTSTRINRLEELAVAGRVMDPAFSDRYIRRAVSVIRSQSRPVRSKAHLRTSEALVELGFDLIKSATDPQNRKHALAFRDGLIIAFLALHPVRRRNLADFKLGRNLIQQPTGFLIVFDGDETKSGAPHEARLADVLVEPMSAYLSVWRQMLAARTGRWKDDLKDAVWVSQDGSPLREEGLSGRIELRTRDAFGKAINPHLFRDAAATTVAIVDPEHVRVAAPVLGHRSFSTTERHYIQATGLKAQRSLLEVIGAIREGQDGVQR
jgi:integrase/recombinase XerD